MRNLLVLFVLITSALGVNAQWSIGVDARLAPFGKEVKRNVGSDIVLNYSKDFAGSFYFMPSVGFFYKNYYGKDRFPSEDARFTSFYQTGVDVSVVVGKKFRISKGYLSIFLGPRYGYSFAEKFRHFDPNRNSLDLRAGVSWTIKRITMSGKFDYGWLTLGKHDCEHDLVFIGTYYTIPTIAIGVAYTL